MCFYRFANIICMILIPCYLAIKAISRRLNSWCQFFWPPLNHFPNKFTLLIASRFVYICLLILVNIYSEIVNFIIAGDKLVMYEWRCRVKKIYHHVLCYLPGADNLPHPLNLCVWCRRFVSVFYAILVNWCSWSEFEFFWELTFKFHFQGMLYWKIISIFKLLSDLWNFFIL